MFPRLYVPVTLITVGHEEDSANFSVTPLRTSVIRPGSASKWKYTLGACSEIHPHRP